MSTRNKPESARGRILYILLITVFMSLANVNIINVTLPSISISLQAGDSQLQWILVSYALVFGVLLIPAGRLGDIFKFEGLYIVGVTVFVIASAVAALSTSPEMLISARTLQGIGAGIISPQTLGMIQHLYPGPSRARALAMFGTTVAVSMGSGPVIGGGLIAIFGAELGWRIGFLFNVPIGIAALVLAVAYFPQPRWNTKWKAQRKSLDIFGIALIIGAVTLVIVPFMLSTWNLSYFALSILGLLTFVVWYRWEKCYSKSGRQPMVDVRILKVSSFRSGISVATLYFFGATSVWVILALYLIDSLGLSALQVGLITVPSAIAGVFSSQLAGRHTERAGPRILRGGLLTATFTLALSSAVILLNSSCELSIWWLLVTMIGSGVGQGLVVPPNQTLTLMGVPKTYSGSVGGVLQTAQRIGSAIGIAVVSGAFFGLRGTVSPASAAVISFGIIGASFLLAAFLSPTRSDAVEVG